MGTNENVPAKKSPSQVRWMQKKVRFFFLKWKRRKQRIVPVFFCRGLMMCNSERDKVLKRRVVYGELGGKGQAQGDGSSTRT